MNTDTKRREVLQGRSLSTYDMVAEFNDHFEVPRSQALGDHRLPHDFQLLKITHMREELDEYRQAVDSGDMEQAFDALIDLVYVALGAAHAHRFCFDEGFKRVHDVNMLKRRAERAGESKRNSKFDVVKPEGWKPASLTDLL